MDDKIDVLNVGQPGKTYRADRAKFDEMRRHILSVLPGSPPGMTVAAVNAAVRPLLSQELFSGGTTCGWWVKCVHLDLEARGVVSRVPAPVRLWRTQPDPG